VRPVCFCGIVFRRRRVSRFVPLLRPFAAGDATDMSVIGSIRRLRQDMVEADNPLPVMDDDIRWLSGMVRVEAGARPHACAVRDRGSRCEGVDGAK